MGLSGAKAATRSGSRLGNANATTSIDRKEVVISDHMASNLYKML